MLTLKKNFLKEYGIAVVAYTGTEKDVKQVIKARDKEKGWLYRNWKNML